MFTPLLTRLLKHLVDQNDWARADLLPFAGRAVQLGILPANMMLIVLEDGGLAPAGAAAQPEATVRMTPTTALRILAGDEAASRLVTIEGDAELGAALAQVLRGMQWEYEEDLSRIIGDAPAHELAALGRNAATGARRQAWNLGEMLSEYWQEEQPLLAKKRHVQQFVGEVDTLRDDAERLAKRIEKLEARLASSETVATHSVKGDSL
jgi:ubiquinone biosynthesis protein UbiJ